MQIKLFNAYSGVLTREQVIPAGTYDIDDPAVKAIHGYLVENGHAAYEGVLDDETDLVSALQSMSDESLREYAAENAIDLGKVTKRETIIERILSAEANNG